jgi:hypothetical protein
MPDQKSSPEVRRTLARIAVEIVVGFVGVYAAFALSAYHEHQDLVDRRHQIKRALIVEIKDLSGLARRNQSYHAVLAAFDSAVKAGTKPIPMAFTEAVAISPHVWEATKQAGGLNLIDVPTFVEASNFYNEMSEMLGFYAQLRELSVNVILPASDVGPDAFYNKKTGALRSDVRRVYYWDLKALDNIARDAARHGDSLVKMLARDTI